jgi:hypothetical protein
VVEEVGIGQRGQGPLAAPRSEFSFSAEVYGSEKMVRVPPRAVYFFRPE